jgi:ABC-type sugar transport system ATPase subunit
MLAKQFSGGNQQRIVFAKWLAVNPKILIIDEPTNGVDIGSKSAMHQIIKDLAVSGISIIMVSSELPEILRISDRILVMRSGRIVKELDPLTTTQEEILTISLMPINTREKIV